MLGDTDTDTNNQRWSDTDIRAAIDDMLAEMYVVASSQDPSGFLVATDLTYTASARSTALPAGIEAANIYKVENIDDTSAPVYLSYRSVLDLNRFSDEHGWSLEGQSLCLRPVPTGARTLRIYTLAPYVPQSSAATPSTDQHAAPVNHEELICLGAATALQETDNEVSVTRPARLAKLWERYEMSVSRYSGPTYVRNTRILLN